MSYKHHLFSVSVLTTSIALSAAVQAETKTEEVLVTGELRDTPVLQLANSVTVLDTEDLKLREARHLEDTLNLAPNVNFSTGASRGRYIQIRGIGERSEFLSPINPSVGVLVDGIDFSGISTGVTNLDIQQTEIFRGPQGTLFGANALAGMINVVGHQIEEGINAEISGGYGNYNSHFQKAVGNFGLSDAFGARIAVLHNASDGYIDNAYLNRDDTNNISETSARILFEFSPTESININWVNYLIDVDNGYDAFSLDNTRTTLSDQPGEDAQETFASAFNIEADLGSVNLDSTLSIQNSDIDYSYDEDWSFRNICAIESDCAFWQYSSTDLYERENNNQSLDTRLLSNTEGAFSWVLGVYARNQSNNLDRTRTDNMPAGDPYDLNDTPEEQPYRFEFDTQNIALYGEASVELGTITLTAGARHETRDAELILNNTKLDDRSEDLWGGKVSAEIALSSEQFIYALASRGYKAGGYNPELFGLDFNSLPVDSSVQFFDTEFQWNYEIGYKGTTLDGRWTNQVALFYQDREDVQVDNSFAESVDEFISYIANAAETKSYGLELESHLQVIDTFAISASLGLLETEFETFDSPSHVDAVAGETFSLSGRDLAHAPKLQFFVAAQYDISNALYVRAEAEGKSDFYYSDSHSEKSPSYELANFRLGYDAGKWDLALWVKNAFDKTTANRGFYFSNDFGNDPRKFYAPETYEQFGTPRTFGVSGSVQF